MKKTRLVATVLVLCLGSASQTGAQQIDSGASGAAPAGNLLAAMWRQKRPGFSLMPASRTQANSNAFNFTPAVAGPNVPVLGSGTLGRLTKWAGFTIGNSVISDSSIVEDKFFNVGIGMEPTDGRLSVAGIIHSTGGFRFADGTLMTTAGLTSIAHDSSLSGIGTLASPLGISPGGVGPGHLANGAVTALKLGTMTGPGPGQVLGFNGSNLIWQTPATGTITGVTAGTGLSGGGTSGNVSVGIADGGVNTLQLGESAVTGPKIASGQVVKSVNGLFDNLTLAAGSNVTITPAGSTLTIASSAAGLTSVAHDSTLKGNGTAGSLLGINIPLILTGVPGLDRGLIEATAQNGAIGVIARGSIGRDGVQATGGSGEGFFGFSGVGGGGVCATGGSSQAESGGPGVVAFGGGSSGPGKSGGAGIVATGGAHAVTPGLAGQFMGAVEVAGNFSVTGGGTKNFKIDHPLDPENKYLYHAAIESSEVLNVYSGNITTDENGDAAVTLPDWFEAINRDFRYQLTVIGTFAHAIVADEIKGNRFKIKTNAPGIQVSWQVTGVRSDPGARRNGFIAEEDKPERERGSYLNPEAYGQPEERGAEWARNPALMKEMKQKREEFQRIFANGKARENNR